MRARTNAVRSTRRATLQTRQQIQKPATFSSAAINPFPSSDTVPSDAFFVLSFLMWNFYVTPLVGVVIGVSFGMALERPGHQSEPEPVSRPRGTHAPNPAADRSPRDSPAQPTCTSRTGTKVRTRQHVGKIQSGCVRREVKMGHQAWKLGNKRLAYETSLV